MPQRSSKSQAPKSNWEPSICTLGPSKILVISPYKFQVRENFKNPRFNRKPAAGFEREEEIATMRDELASNS
jgi:hypothetical protein